MANFIEQIEEVIAKASGVSIEEIHGDSRAVEIVEARHAIWYMLNTHFLVSAKQLGRLYGKNHTSIIHGVKRFRDSGAGEVVKNRLFATHTEMMKRVPTDAGFRVENWNFTPVDIRGDK